MEPTLEEIQKVIDLKRAKLKPRKIKHFPVDTRFLVGMDGCLPYRVVNNVN